MRRAILKSHAFALPFGAKAPIAAYAQVGVGFDYSYSVTKIDANTVTLGGTKFLFQYGIGLRGRPAVVADELIEALQQLPEQAPQRLIQPGQQVKIVAGPLRGLEGIYQQADGELRAMVLIELLSKQHLIPYEVQSLLPQTS
jgi:transcriptional antiterminator RfaH